MAKPNGVIDTALREASMPAETPVDPKSPLILAWEQYKASEEYANTRSWALHAEHVDGSLWAAFERGYRIARDLQREEDTRDAARYRWLRNGSFDQWKYPICVTQERTDFGMHYIGPCVGESLDAAIDAAIREQQ
jgi:hypothetical protein